VKRNNVSCNVTHQLIELAIAVIVTEINSWREYIPNPPPPKISSLRKSNALKLISWWSWAWSLHLLIDCATSCLNIWNEGRWRWCASVKCNPASFSFVAYFRAHACYQSEARRRLHGGQRDTEVELLIKAQVQTGGKILLLAKTSCFNQVLHVLWTSLHCKHRWL